MKLYLPVIYSSNSKWLLDALEAEIPEISGREAPEIVISKDGDRSRLRYRMHEGRLYRPIEDWAVGGGMRPADFGRFRSMEAAISSPERHPNKSYFGRRNPFFDAADPMPFWGTHGRFDVARGAISQEDLAGTRMGRVCRDIADHTILVDGLLHRETVGPILVPERHGAYLRFSDTHTRSYIGYLAFGIHDLDLANEYSDRRRLGRIVMHGADQIPKYDPAPRMLECIADMLRDHAFKYRINDMSRDYVERYMAVEKLMREGWRGTPANEGGPPVWPYQEYHRHNLIAARLAPMMETVYSLYPLSYGEMKDAKAIARIYIESGRIPHDASTLDASAEVAELADFTL